MVSFYKLARLNHKLEICKRLLTTSPLPFLGSVYHVHIVIVKTSDIWAPRLNVEAAKSAIRN